MNIFAIDPGTTSSAIVLLSNGGIVESNKIPNEDLTGTIETIQFRGHPFVVACEHIQCFGMAVGAEVFETAYWIGEIRQYCKSHQIKLYRVFRSEEKMTLCQSMRAKDKNIRQALIDRFGIVGTKKNPGPLFGISGDMWSALAVAVVCSEKLGTPRQKECYHEPA